MLRESCPQADPPLLFDSYWMNMSSAAPIKRTAVERMVNVQIVFLFGILLALSLGSSIGSVVRNNHFGSDMWYLFLGEQGGAVKVFVEDVLTFIILYNNLIPIRWVSLDSPVASSSADSRDVHSLIVTMEVVKFQQAILINSDLGKSALVCVWILVTDLRCQYRHVLPCDRHAGSVSYI